MHKHFGINYDPLRFKIWYSPCTQKSLLWTEEIKRSALLVSQSTDRDIWVCMSGGIDSEIVAHTFKELNIPFQAFIVKFSNNLNEHDIVHAIRWCKDNKIKYRIFDFDVINFIKIDYKKYLTHNLIVNNIFRYFSIELINEIENMNGFAVLGGKSVGLRLLQCNEDVNKFTQNSVHDCYDIGSLAPLEWCQKNNLNHCVFFYQASSEIHQAYLNDPVNQMLIHNPYMLRATSINNCAKILMMRSHFPSATPRPKFHGFEKITKMREETEINIANYFGLDTNIVDKKYKNMFYNNQIVIPINQVIKQLSNE